MYFNSEPVKSTGGGYNRKNYFPTVKNPLPVLKILFALALIFPLFFTSCNPLYEGDEEARLSINLPPITNQSRSISGERVEALQKTTASYRVTVNKVTREGTGTSYTFTLPVGARANVTVECLNSSGEVIVRAEKSHLVTAGENNVRISIKNDGNEIINTGLYYSYGDAAAGGVATGLPSGRKIEVGGKFTVDDGSAMTWEHAEASAGSGGSGFTGWKTNVALTGDTDTQTPDAQAGGDVQLGGTYIMPDGNVTLAAQWNKKKYSLSYDYNIPSEAVQGAGSGKPTDTNPQDAFSKVAVGSETPTLTATGQQWTFKYWTLTPADSGTQYRTGQQVTLTGDTTLYAQWTNESVWRVDFAEPATKPSAYTANMPQGNVVKQGQPFSWTNPAARGWTFGGWEVSGAIPMTLDASTTQVTPNADTTLTAKWTPITYTIKFNTGSGSSVNDISNFTVNGSDSFASNPPTYTGYTFGGWQYNSTPIADAAALRTAITNGSVTATGNNEITLTAQWTATQYSISLNGNGAGGTLSNPFSGKYTVDGSGGTSSSITVATVPTNANSVYSGKIFDGWALTAGGNKLTANTNITEVLQNGTASGTAITLYAKWADAEASVTVGSTETNYATVAQAFTAASGQTATIKVQKDATGVVATMDGGTITLNMNSRKLTGDGQNTVITIKGGGSLTLDGNGIITGGGGRTDDGGGGVLVIGNSTFTMKNGEISGNTNSRGAGVSVKYGTFTMESGKITGNTGDYGGGVYLYAQAGSASRFVMEDGEISNNTGSTYGGGVYIMGSSYAPASFTMRGGEIKENKSDSMSTVTDTNGAGGGVMVSGTFTMEGGSISSNTASRTGGGVHIDDGGTFTMTGGDITGNKTTSTENNKGRGGGVYISNGTFTLSGNATTISNNRASREGGGVYVVNNTGTFGGTGGALSGNKANYDESSPSTATNSDYYGTYSGSANSGSWVKQQ